jgi:hypothetical protein
MVINLHESQEQLVHVRTVLATKPQAASRVFSETTGLESAIRKI